VYVSLRAAPLTMGTQVLSWITESGYMRDLLLLLLMFGIVVCPSRPTLLKLRLSIFKGTQFCTLLGHTSVAGTYAAHYHQLLAGRSFGPEIDFTATDGNIRVTEASAGNPTVFER